MEVKAVKIAFFILTVCSWGFYSQAQTQPAAPSSYPGVIFVSPTAPPAPEPQVHQDVYADNLVPVINAPAPSATPISVTPPMVAPQGLSATVDPKNFYASIRQIDVEGKRAVAIGGWEITKLQVGTPLVALLDGQNCFLNITQIEGNIIQLDGSHCRFFDKLEVGQKLEPSLFPGPKPTHDRYSIVTDEERDNRLRFAVSLYYGLGSSLDSDNLTYMQSGQTYAGSGSLEMNTAPGVALELYQAPDGGFGWSGGVSYDFNRQVSGLNAYANSSSIGGNFTQPNATLSLITVYGNFIFRSGPFYFPVGLNYTIPSFVGGTNSFGNTSLVGGMGLQLAAGYIIDDNLAFELWVQSLSLDGTTVTPYGTIEYNGLNFTNTQLRLRFSF